MSVYRKINWLNTIFLFTVPVVAFVGLAILWYHHLIVTNTIILAVVWMILSGLGITAGYHRLFSHVSYRAHPIVQFFLLLFGASNFEGSVLEWSTDHRNHHRYTDTDRDPYDIKKGFWFAHMGWLLYLDTSKRDFSNVADLEAMPLARWQHKHFVSLAILIGFIAPTLIASLWGDPWGGFIIAGCLRLTLNHQSTFCINSICHLWGKRPYSDQQSARDSWVTALFTFGEGYHNFHHQFPKDYRNGVRWYQYDLSKWLIFALKKVGLARDLYRISQQQIIRYRMRSDEARINLNSYSAAKLADIQKALEPIKEAVLHALKRLEQLEQEYHQLKQQGVSLARRQRLKLKLARRNVADSLSDWSELMQTYAKVPVLS